MMSSAERRTARWEEWRCRYEGRCDRRETLDEGRLVRGWMLGADAMCRRYACALGASVMGELKEV